MDEKPKKERIAVGAKVQHARGKAGMVRLPSKDKLFDIILKHTKYQITRGKMMQIADEIIGLLQEGEKA